MRARASALALALAAGCTASVGSGPELEAAVGELARAGFAFDPDVRFASGRYTSCNGVACADLRVVAERRTVLLAEQAFDNPSRLRASLLEIWERYREPRPGSIPDLARGALRVVRDGPRVGVRDAALLRRAHHSYRGLWEQLPPDRRRELPDPDELDYP